VVTADWKLKEKTELKNHKHKNALFSSTFSFGYKLYFAEFIK